MRVRPLTSAQIRAARALIRWRAQDLARASAVGVATIRRAELAEEETSLTAPNDAAIRRAFEAAGVEFIDVGAGGVLLRKPRFGRSKDKGAPRPPQFAHAVLKRGAGVLFPALPDKTQPMLPLDVPAARTSRSSNTSGIDTADAVVVTSELVRAARALLRWEQRDLSNASSVSLPTIKRLEAKRGVIAANATTVAALRRALESAGIEFADGPSPGVKLKGAHALTGSDRPRRGSKEKV